MTAPELVDPANIPPGLAPTPEQCRQRHDMALTVRALLHLDRAATRAQNHLAGQAHRRLLEHLRGLGLSPAKATLIDSNVRIELRLLIAECFAVAVDEVRNGLATDVAASASHNMPATPAGR